MEFDIVSAETLKDPADDGGVALLLERPVTEHPGELEPSKHPRFVATSHSGLYRAAGDSIRETGASEAVLEERGIEP